MQTILVPKYKMTRAPNFVKNEISVCKSGMVIHQIKFGIIYCELILEIAFDERQWSNSDECWAWNLLRSASAHFKECGKSFESFDSTFNLALFFGANLNNAYNKSA